jgi:hypothetical protein
LGGVRGIELRITGLIYYRFLPILVWSLCLASPSNLGLLAQGIWRLGPLLPASSLPSVA